jgi:hypothetical protein
MTEWSLLAGLFWAKDHLTWKACAFFAGSIVTFVMDMTLPSFVAGEANWFVSEKTEVCASDSPTV